MKSSQRSNNGKAIKWIDTRFALPSIRRSFLLRMQMSGLSMQAAQAVEVISCAPAHSPEQKARKAIAIAEVIINNNIAQIKLINASQAPKTAYVACQT